MALSSSDRVIAATDVVFRLLGDEAVLLNLRTEQYLGLNPVGARMWTVLTGAESVSAACAELLQEYRRRARAAAYGRRGTTGPPRRRTARRRRAFRTAGRRPHGMSGIVGLLNLDGSPVEAALLGRMTDFLAFRGPDGHHSWSSSNVGLGHALLTTTDEPSARPVHPFTLDGRYWIVADARIDARDELADALSGCATGVTRSTATDAELIVRSYEVWGEQCVERLLGDFTFAVWDASRQRLFCARDQLGVKPLYYVQSDRVIAFSNTLDCLRLHPAVSRDLNDESVADFLLFGENRAPDTTVFTDIRKLPAAHCVTWSVNGATRRRYWTLPIDAPVHFARADAYSEQFVDLLQTAVRDRLRTRRVGVFMSGGLDSPALASTAAGLLRQDPADYFLQAMTSVYDRLVPEMDRPFATEVAEFLDIPIHFDVRDDETSITNWPEAIVHTPEPVANPAAFSAGVRFLAGRADLARVFLYGEGPDNALRYEWRPYLSHLVRTKQPAVLARAIAGDIVWHPRVPLWSSVRRIAGAPSHRARWRQRFPRWLNEAFARRCDCEARWEAAQRPLSSAHPARPAGYAGFDAVRWAPLFEDCDLNGALTRSEIRHPFLDLRLLRFMLALPAMPWCRNKLIVRRSMRGTLPTNVIRRKKTPRDASPDFERVRTSGLPRFTPSPDVLRYVNPDLLPARPETALELRSALRPIGLNYWLHHQAHN